MLEFLTLIISVGAQLFLGGLVLKSDSRRDVNRSFFYLSLSLALWSFFTYWSLHPAIFSQLVLIRLVLGAATFLCFFLFLTFLLFPNRQLRRYKFVRWVLLYTIFVAIITQTPLVFSGLETTDGGASPIVAPGMIFFMGQVACCIGGAVAILIRRYRRGNTAERHQLRPVIAGVLITFLGIVITNFLLVTVFKTSGLVFVGPALTLVFLGCLAFAISRHHMFDIRAAVARAVTYSMSIGVIVLIYTGGLYVLTTFASPIVENQTTERLAFVIFAIITAAAYQPLKRFFDRITNKAFFHDAYDPQQMLDELSNLLVTNYELEKLADLASEVITRQLKVQFCSFYIPKSTKEHLFGTKRDTSLSNADEIMNLLDSKITLVHSGEDLHDKQKELYELVRPTGAELVAELTTTTDKVGIMLLGPKKGGDNITRGDVKVIDIFTDELALAFQNAARFEEISTFNATLQQKIEAATQELRRTNEKLKALDEAKDEFISMASHQLRTPLTSVKGYVSLVLEGDAGEIPEQQRTLLSQAFNSAQRMVYLISDLLNVSRLRTGKFIIEPTDIYLPDIIEEEIKQVAETAKAKSVELVYEKPSEFPHLQLDDNKIRQVIMNFIDNGIYYTPSGGKVTLELAAHSESIEFRVIDNGIGVPKSEQHKLFTKFYRAGNAQKARPDGTGLGLFMAKKVIVASGGAIIFKSQEGKGSTFGFTFPLDPKPLELVEKEEESEE